MKKILFVTILLIKIFFLEAQIPTVGLVVWFIGDSVVEIGGKAQVLKDLSGNGFDLTQMNPSLQPFVVNNGFHTHKTIKFTGSQWLEKNFGTTFSQPITIFFVSSITEPGTYFFFDWGSPRFCYYTSQMSGYTWLRQHAGGEFILYFPKIPPLPFMLQRLEYNGAASKLFVNENMFTSGDAGNNGMSGMRIGSAYYGGYYLNGEIAEIIIYQRLLDSSEIRMVVDYLLNKYAPPANLGPDIVENYSLCLITLTPGPGYESYLWSTGDTTSSIQVTSSGTYWVQVKDVFGRISRDTINVFFPFHPLSDVFFCHGDTIQVTSGLSGQYHITWNDTIFHDSLHIFSSGQYRLHAVDTNGCEIRDTMMAVVDSIFYYFSLGRDTSVCQHSYLGYQSSQSLIQSYLWNTGDTSPYIRIDTAGTYWCEATSFFGCKKRDTINVNLRGVKPLVSFLADTVCFGDSSTLWNTTYVFPPEQISSMTWYIPTIDTIHISHAFSNPLRIKFFAPGEHIVRLMVQTDSGCVGDTMQWVKIRPLPQVQFVPEIACTRKAITFVDQSSSANGIITERTWEINGNIFVNQSSVIYTFDTIGYYPVFLAVTDMQGCRDTLRKLIFVRETPLANFSVIEACHGQAIRFLDSTVVSPFAFVTQYKYLFGDGNSSTFPNPSHLYDSAGTYTVTLIVKSVNGCADTAKKNITVHSLPIVRVSHSLPCAQQHVCFEDSSSISVDSLAKFRWVIGVDTLFGQHVCYFLPDTTAKQVKYQVVSSFGCAKDTVFTLRVYPSPHADFDIQPEYGVPPLDVQCYNYSSGSDSYLWFFGDDAYSFLTNPSHTYTSDGIFQILLVAENAYGCRDSAYRHVYVIPSILDLKLVLLTWVDSLGYLYPTLKVYNNSSRRVRSMHFDVQVNQTLPIREYWTGSLLPGENLVYKFHVGFQKPKDADIIVCGMVEANDVIGQEDRTPMDNVFCNANAARFFITKPFPNPTSGIFSLDIFFPDAGNGSILMFDEAGKEVYRTVFTSEEQSFIRKYIDISSFDNGIYYVCVRFNEDQFCESIILRR